MANSKKPRETPISLKPLTPEALKALLSTPAPSDKKDKKRGN